MAEVTIIDFLADIYPWSVKETGRRILHAYPDTCPDWLRILAGGNLEAWESVLDEARRAYEAEQEKE